MKRITSIPNIELTNSLKSILTTGYTRHNTVKYKPYRTKNTTRLSTFPDINHCGTAIYLYICKLTGAVPSTTY